MFRVSDEPEVDHTVHNGHKAGGSKDSDLDIQNLRALKETVLKLQLSLLESQFCMSSNED